MRAASPSPSDAGDTSMHISRFTMFRQQWLPLLASVVFAAAGLHAATATAGGNRFKASGPDMGADEASELRTPLQFEEEAADNPQLGNQILFSRCRQTPFAGNPALYAALAGQEHDAIVGDTTFGFADGS